MSSAPTRACRRSSSTRTACVGQHATPTLICRRRRHTVSLSKCVQRSMTLVARSVSIPASISDSFPSRRASQQIRLANRDRISRAELGHDPLVGGDDRAS